MSSSCNAPEPPDRVVLNFLEKCNMACSYCYCPFDGERTEFEVLGDIVSILSHWRVGSITYGGGDPFGYNRFGDLLALTRNQAPSINFIQVDTNGLGISDQDYAVIVQSVDLLGLPLDGPTALVHARLRGAAEHFTRVCSLIEDMLGLGVAVKINTVVSPLNVDSLREMALIIQDYDIAVWSLYEMWPIARTHSASSKQERLAPDRFLNTVEELHHLCPSVEIEAGSICTRQAGYFFISQNGHVYTVSPSDPSQYVSVGSIFSSDILEKWHTVAGGSMRLDPRLSRRLAVVKGRREQTSPIRRVHRSHTLDRQTADTQGDAKAD